MKAKFTKFLILLLLTFRQGFGQEIKQIPYPRIPELNNELRITNFSPYFTLHVDSFLSYKLEINKPQEEYYWYLKNAPVGLRIDKDNGHLSFKPEKSLFRSGRLKYDIEYKVSLGVQNLSDPSDRIDTSFTLIIYNTEIIPSKIKPNAPATFTIEEGEEVSFKVFCETGSIPFDNIQISYDLPIYGYKNVRECGDTFAWTPPFDFIRETESEKTKSLTLFFIGSDKYNTKDTARIRLIVKDAVNYPYALQEYKRSIEDIDLYIKQLKFHFMVLDKQLKTNRITRNSFDITAALTVLVGTVLSTTGKDQNVNLARILQSAGVVLVPLKEVIAPVKNLEQSQARSVRSAIQRLEYLKSYYALVGEKDFTILSKTTRMKDELKQTKVELADVPTALTPVNINSRELDTYFNNKRVNKKYIPKKKKKKN